MFALWLTAGVLGQASETPAAPLPRGDDAGGTFSFTGQAKAAIYERLLAELKTDEQQPVLQQAAQQKAKNVVRSVVSLAPDVPALRQQTEAQANRFLEEFLSEQIDYGAFASAILSLLQKQEADARKKRNRSIALAMMMAA